MPSVVTNAPNTAQLSGSVIGRASTAGDRPSSGGSRKPSRPLGEQATQVLPLTGRAAHDRQRGHRPLPLRLTLLASGGDKGPSDELVTADWRRGSAPNLFRPARDSARRGWVQ